MVGENGEELELSIGSFDDPGVLAPQYESWIIHREPWLTRLGIPEFEQDRTSGADGETLLSPS